jgi:catechol 2,3-dioxygenase-like lactoylglutathione lyase family enzyme
MRGISHVAIGVSDMERSLRFYRDLLGLTVTLDKEEPVRGSERLFADPAQNRRRAVYLKWAEGPKRALWCSRKSRESRRDGRSKSTSSGFITSRSG